MQKFSLTKGKGIFVIDLTLIPIFILVIYSGLKLHWAGHLNNQNIWEYWAHYHIIVSILSLIFGGLHVKAHWGWYKSLAKNGVGNKSRPTIILSALFLIEIATGIILVLLIEGGNSTIGMWHYRFGITMILFLSGHTIRRFSIMIKGLWLKSLLNNICFKIIWR
jgi:hypothetical protein